MQAISTKNNNASEIRFLSGRVSEVDRGTKIKAFSFEEPMMVPLGQIVLIIVLEQVPLYGRIIHIVGIVVILCSEMDFIKILRSFSGKDVSVKAKPFAI